jgi:hypothetical protein
MVNVELQQASHARGPGGIEARRQHPIWLAVGSGWRPSGPSYGRECKCLRVSKLTVDAGGRAVAVLPSGPTVGYLHAPANPALAEAGALEFAACCCPAIDFGRMLCMGPYLYEARSIRPRRAEVTGLR